VWAYCVFRLLIQSGLFPSKLHIIIRILQSFLFLLLLLDMSLIIHKIQLKEVFFVVSYLLRIVGYPVFEVILSKYHQTLPRNPNIHLSITLPFHIGSSEETFQSRSPQKFCIYCFSPKIILYYILPFTILDEDGAGLYCSNSLDFYSVRTYFVSPTKRHLS